MFPIVLLLLLGGGLYLRHHAAAGTADHASSTMSSADIAAYTDALYSGDPQKMWLESITLEHGNYNAEAATLRQTALKVIGWNAPVDILAEIPDATVGQQFIAAMQACATQVVATLASQYLNADSQTAVHDWMNAHCNRQLVQQAAPQQLHYTQIQPLQQPLSAKGFGHW